MRVEDLLQRHGHVLHWHELQAHVTTHAVVHALRHGVIERVFPSVYVCSAHVGDDAVMLRAAARYVGARGAFSHQTALALHAVTVGHRDARLHVSVPRTVRLRSSSLLSIHRRVEMPPTTMRSGLRVLTLDGCLVDWWGVSTDEQRRAAIITALAERRTTADRLLSAAAQARPPGDPTLNTS